MRWRFHAPGVHVVAFGAGGRARAAADHRRESGAQRLVDELRADEVDVRVESARGHDPPSPAITSVAAPTTIPGDTPAMIVGVAGLADADDAPSRMPMSPSRFPSDRR